MSLVRCPTCDKQFDPQTSRAAPFCSDRCRRIDLNRWLSEEISIPYREVDDDGQTPQKGDDKQEQ
jgi:endogenous inhibitor of DNA gyrase (YacG/DUF329 family)